METTLLDLPGYQVNEYLLVLQPHEDLWNRIMAVKKAFSEKYDCPMALWTKPHITLVNFVQYAIKEEKAVEKMGRIASRNSPFAVVLKDFGSFPTHTIYINISTQTAIVELGKQLREAQALMTLNKDNKPHFLSEPHLTIARKLKPWQYEKGWLEYSNTPFTGMFIADHLLLLKRKVGIKKYEVLKKFELKGEPCTENKGIQLGLFA